METNAGAPRRRNVLIVDDNAALAHFFQGILRMHGYDATVVSDGVMALRHVLHYLTDVVICDLQTPQLDGDLFYATVERDNASLAQRFIFVTGVADDPRYQKFISTVDAPVLRKPVAVAVLLREVGRIASR
jgi:CheY-like chemotaxis protein